MCMEEVTTESTTRHPKHRLTRLWKRWRRCFGRLFVNSAAITSVQDWDSYSSFSESIQTKQTNKTKFIYYIKKLHNMNLGSCQMRSARSDMLVWVPSAAAVEVTAAARLEAAMSERALRIWHEPRFILCSSLM